MEEIDLSEVMYEFLKNKWLIIAITILCVAIGILYIVFLQKPEYTSATTLVLSKSKQATEETETGTNNSLAINQNDVTLNQKLVSTYGEILKSRSIAKSVINELNLNMNEEEFSEKVEVSSKEDTELLEIKVTNNSAEQAADIANCLAKTFTEKVKEVYNIENVSIIDEAQPMEETSNTSSSKIVVISGIAGFLLACFIVFLKMYFNDTIKTQEDVEKILGLNVLATVPKIKD